MIQPVREWNKFLFYDEKMEVLKKIGIISPKAKEIKTLYYKGCYTNNPVICDVVGIVDNNEIIIEVNGKLHSIHPELLLDMQKKDY